MVNAFIESIDYHLPAGRLTNADLSAQFPEWSVEKIASKTGIHSRHIASPNEYSSDLAAAAAERLFTRTVADRSEIDFVILCTQSPDFYMPATAAIVQEKLGLEYGIGATDINLGCSGYVYAIGLAKALIESQMASKVLVLTVDTYSRYVNPGDKSVRTLFGDGASASLVSATDSGERLSGISYGTDGSGAGALIVPNGALGDATEVSPKSDPVLRNLETNGYDLYMDGPEIFNFTLRVVPESVDRILERAGMRFDDIDLFVFHQANAFMLEHLRKKLGIPSEKFFISIDESGNTVSSTIPIALSDAETSGVLARGMRVMLVGFGVGLSWGGLVVTW